MSKFLLAALVPVLFSLQALSADAVRKDRMSDSQIAGLLVTANDGEIRTSRLMLDKAMSEEVRAYALMMIEEHTRANDLLAGETKSRNWVMRSTPMSKQLKIRALTSFAQLHQLPAKTLDTDQAYIRDQIAMHKEVLRLAEEVLMPSADSEAMIAHLNEMRPKIEQHLKDAQQIQKELNKRD